MEKKFKVGDRVKFINVDRHPGMNWGKSIGQLATVVEVLDGSMYEYLIEFDEPGFGLFSTKNKREVELCAFEENLELVPTKKFKVGDRVKFINDSGHNYRFTNSIGHFATVVAVYDDGVYDYRIEFDEPGLGFFSIKDKPCCQLYTDECNLELLPEEPKVEVIAEPTRFTKFLFVQQGSVNTADLAKKLEKTNPEILIVEYSEGTRTPELVEVE